MEAPRGCKIGCLSGVVALGVAAILFVRWWTAPIDIPRPQRPPEPNDNAYEVYRSLAAYQNQQFRTDPWLTFAEREVFGWRETRLDQMDLVYYLLVRTRPIRDEYRRYLNKPCVVIMEYTPEWRLPELVEFRRWANIEALEMTLALEERDYKQALDNFRTVLLLSEQLRTHGSFLHYQIGGTMQRAVLTQMTEAISQLPAPACDQLTQIVREWSQRRVPMTHAIATERGKYLSFLHDLYAGKVAFQRWSPELRLAIRWHPRLLNLRRAAAEGNSFFQQAERESLKPASQRRPLDRPRHRISTLLLPAIDWAVYNPPYTETRILLLGCTAGVRAYYLRNRRYPSSLQEAGVADLAADPLCGGMFVYQQKKHGFLLYSKGTDDKDDGGWRVSERADIHGRGDLALILYPGQPRATRAQHDKGEPVWLR